MSVKVKTEEIRELMRETLAFRGIKGEDAEFMIDDYMESELEGHRTHGISKFLTIDAGIRKKESEDEVIRHEASYAQIEGHRQLGHIAALHATDLAIDMAKKTGIGIVGFSNISRYARITPYARRIADAGLIGILMNNGGPECCAPFGGKEPIFGTNPICFAFPSNREKPYIFDFATAQKVWGEIRQAVVEGRELAPNSFLAADGQFTRDPEKAVAGVAFGGPKGYALMFALEVLTGAFVGAKMGHQGKDEYDLGYLFMAFSPDMFSDLESFRKEMDALANDVKNSAPAKEGGQVFIPGEIFGNQKVSEIDYRFVELPDDVYERLKKMSHSLEGGYEDTKAMN